MYQLIDQADDIARQMIGPNAPTDNLGHQLLIACHHVNATRDTLGAAIRGTQQKIRGFRCLKFTPPPA
jgi:hypothetical protein